MSKKRAGWYEREEISKVTLDWLKANFKPTAREMELLEIIRCRKLVRRDQLEILSPSYRHVGENRTRLINRALKRLFVNMCIDKVCEKKEFGEGNHPFTIALDRGGSLLLGLSHKKRIPHIKKLVNGKEYIFRGIPLILRHANGINQIEVETILFCEENGYSIVEWQHEKGREFTYGNEKITIIPDSFIVLDVKGKKVFIYLEYDTGNEDIRMKTSFPTIYNKIIKYRKFKLSKLWEEHADYFPLILFVTEDDKRISYFNEKCNENKIKGFGVYYENYTKFLSRLISIIK